MKKTEIELRMSEIGTLLSSEEEVDVDALEKEVAELRSELSEIEKRERKDKIAKDIETGKTEAIKIEEPVEGRNMEEMNIYESKEYRSAFLKSLQSKPLNEAEKREFTLVPNTAGAVVPTSTANMIFDNMTKIAPMLNEIQLLRVAGNLRFAVQGVRNAAAAHAEGVAVVPAADTISKRISA
jgi:HK97 family phage major capsid protein